MGLLQTSFAYLASPRFALVSNIAHDLQVKVVAKAPARYDLRRCGVSALLTPETLEHVFRELVELQKSGRLVGVIARMPALRELTPTRLEVMPKVDGTSSARIAA